MDNQGIVKELVTVARELVAAELPLGHFLAVKDFRIGFGSWYMRFLKGTVIRSERGHLFSWSGQRGDWVERVPPISGTRSFSLGHYGQTMEQKEQLAVFNESTRKISLLESNRLTIQSEQRLVIRVGDMERVVQGLGLRPRDKITIIVPPQR